MLTSTEIPIEESKERLLMIQNLVEPPGKIQKGLAVTAAGVSAIAVLTVPYLVLRSVFYLVSHEENFTFKEMLHSDKTEFWIFGPPTALLATIAIAPFNMYNAYKTIITIELNKNAYTATKLLKVLSGIFLTFTGSVSGYITNNTIDDIWPASVRGKHAFKYPAVSISVLFAGISDARVFLDYLAKDLTRDWRYFKRTIHSTYRIAKKHSPFFTHRYHHQTSNRITRKKLLQQLRSKLDDLKIIILLALNDTEVNQLKELYEDHGWLKDVRSNSTELQHYLQIFTKQFPFGRFIGSEVFGSIISGLLAYYGNKNTYEYTYKAVSSFLLFCNHQINNALLKYASGTISIISYITGFFVSFFLIRDLFFRDLFKATTWAEFKVRLPKLLIPLIPALSFGLLNVILTVLNTSLSPLEKVLVSCSAIIGATVVTRYGIEGGIEQLRGRPNQRHELANITDVLMAQFSQLETEELIQLYNQIKQITDPLQKLVNQERAESINFLSSDNEIITDIEGVVADDKITTAYARHQ